MSAMGPRTQLLMSPMGATFRMGVTHSWVPLITTSQLAAGSDTWARLYLLAPRRRLVTA